MSTEAVSPEELGFSAAMAELEQIVASLESDGLDVDELAEKVSRAAEIVDWCRSKLDATRFQVEKIVERLDGATAESADE
ncbi:MAG: exodeoxyribonuclease VII small subunit [Actinobacteria bacterium]|jgi:exodeoxyribonuclease VII small subunit|nr:exodeoxyribonuclease VII small subunit [Actinomycetota bacterium]